MDGALDTGQAAVRSGNNSLNLEEMDDAVMRYLLEHRKGTFADIVTGVVGSADSALRDIYSNRIRDALRVLAESFCIYMDGDRYCAL